MTGVTELAGRFAGVVDVDELVAALEAAGINDRVAARRYGVPSVFALGEAVLACLRDQPARPPRPAPFLWAALRRGGLHLVPVLAAVTAAGHLDRVPWQVPAGAAVLGWTGARVLVGAHRVAAGFALLAAAWCGLVALAPPHRIGPDRPLAYAIGLTALALFAVIALGAPRRPAGSVPVRLLTALGQAGAVILVWRAAPGTPPPAAVPLVLAVPLLELLVGWHAARSATALDAYDDLRAFRREVRDLATVTVGALVPPLVIGVALGAAAYQLPYRLSGHPQVRATVLGLAAGLLLGGVLAVTLLLSARGRPRAAAVVAAGPVALTAGLAAAVPFFGWRGVLLPCAVATLAVTYLLGLVATAHAVFDAETHR